jgi:outer membrane receptor protein involved in Fe transport
LRRAAASSPCVNGQTGSKQFHNRTTVDASIAHSASDLLKGSHDFKIGVQTAYATQRTVTIRFGGVSFTDLNGAPYLATYRDPAASGGRIRSAGTYLQDNWTVNDRLTLNVGVRYDRIAGDIPELSASAALDGIRGDTTFDVSNSTTYPAVPGLMTLNSVSPRAGLALRLDSSAKTVLKANYGRFYGKLATGMFNSMSPGDTPTTVLRWNGATGTYDIPFSFVDNKVNFGVNADRRTPSSCRARIARRSISISGCGIPMSPAVRTAASSSSATLVRGM